MQQVDDKPPHMLTNIGLHEASVQIPLMEMPGSRACLLVYTDYKPARSVQFSPTNLTSSPLEVQAFKILPILPFLLSMIQHQLSSCQSPMFPLQNPMSPLQCLMQADSRFVNLNQIYKFEPVLMINPTPFIDSNSTVHQSSHTYWMSGKEEDLQVLHEAHQSVHNLAHHFILQLEHHQAHQWANNLSHHLAHSLAHHLGHHLAHNLAQHLSNCLAYHLAYHLEHHSRQFHSQRCS